MTDEELIDYCDIHADTPLALFHRSHINRMLALAGHPKHFVHSIEQEWLSVHAPMKELVKIARTRQRRNALHVVSGEPR